MRVIRECQMLPTFEITLTLTLSRSTGRGDQSTESNLDADITFDREYLEFLVRKFADNPKLGVGGTPFIEDASQPDNHSYAHRFADLQHVSGACQMFRRECLEELGGYTPIKGGGIDWVAVTSARMKGWQTRTFTEKTCFHHRKMGTASRGPLMARFHHGREDYYVGQHPLWQLLRGLFQMKSKPVVLGSRAPDGSENSSIGVHSKPLSASASSSTRSTVRSPSAIVISPAPRGYFPRSKPSIA